MAQSTDEKITTDLIETLEDGKAGFTQAAEKVADSDRADLATVFAEFAAQRGRFSDELRTMAAEYGDDIDESGSMAGALHRGWMSIKDAVSGSDPAGVINAAVTGEDHAVTEYEDALAAREVSPRLRSVIERQFVEVKQTADRVKALATALD